MPRYYFDVDDSVAIRDQVGQDCVDDDGAQAEAFRRAAQYGADPANLRRSGAIVVTIYDRQRTPIAKVRLVCQVQVFDRP